MISIKKYKEKGKFKKYTVYEYLCDCGEIIKVAVNVYDNSNSGQSTCIKCNSSIYIN